jgi:NADH:ubiquinone oxidoreductase subunit D
MSSSGILRHVAVLRTSVSEERIASIIMVQRIRELGTTSAVTNNSCYLLTVELLVTADVVTKFLILAILMTEAIRSSETLVLERATRRHIPEEGILY